MIALLGPPPPQFLERSANRVPGEHYRFWTSDGAWKPDLYDIPTISLETRCKALEGEDRELFLRFIRRTLRWLPEDRPTARELATDAFLMQPLSDSRPSHFRKVTFSAVADFSDIHVALEALRRKYPHARPPMRPGEADEDDEEGWVEKDQSVLQRPTCGDRIRGT